MGERAEDRHPRLEALVARLRPARPLPTAVVHPCDHDSLLGAVAAADDGLIEPILVAPAAKLPAIRRETS
jgi:phosphate acetyltransferase